MKVRRTIWDSLISIGRCNLEGLHWMLGLGRGQRDIEGPSSVVCDLMELQFIPDWWVLRYANHFSYS